MGKYDDSVAKAMAVPVVAKGERAPASQASVAKGLDTVTQALAGSPTLVQSGKYAGSVQKAKDIASGNVSDTGGGIAGLFGKTIGKGLQGIGYVAGLPARTVTSIVKETSDLFDGEGFSVKELVTQPFESDFYASKFMPKTGNKWLDITIGLGTDILTDPVTWVAPNVAIGRAGRLALAAKAGEKAMIAKAPSLASKADDIVRYGEWALDDIEREVLNIPKGLRWQFGTDAPIFKPDTLLGKVSGGVAQATGKPFATARATLGDIKGLDKVQGFIRPRSYGGALNALGRRADLDGVDVLREVSRYSAALRFRAERTFVEQSLTGLNKDLLKELEASPFRSTVYEVIEGTAARTGRAVPAEEQALANRITRLFADARETGNTATQKFATKRGVNPQEIGFVEDYFMGSLSPQATSMVTSRKFGRGRFDKTITNILEVSPKEFVSGSTIMRARTLKKGEKWLGKVLQFGDKQEINAISNEVLGFDWFKTDALSVIADQFDSVSKQAGRIAFADRLFDYGTDVVDKMVFKMVPDKELVAVAKKSYTSLSRAYARIANKIDSLERQGSAQVSKVAGGLAGKSEARTGAGVLLREELAQLNQDVVSARRALTNARRASTNRSKEITASFETILQPLEIRIKELENILASGASQEELASALLKSLHVRAFPNMDDALRPTSYVELSKQLKGDVTAQFDARSAELAVRAQAGEDVTKLAGAAKGKATKGNKQIESAVADIRSARDSTKGLKGELKTTKAEVTRQKRIMEQAIKGDPVVKKVKDATQAHVRSVNAMNSKEALLPPQFVWENSVKPQLDSAINEIKAGVSGRNFAKGLVGDDREAALNVTRAWVDNNDRLMKQLAADGMLTDAQRDAWDRVITSMRAAEVDFAKVSGDVAYANATLKALRDPTNALYGNMVADVKQGWTAIEQLGIQLPKETKKALFAGLERFESVEQVKEFVKIFNKYNQFFRVTAMLNPGFVVRNAYTAAFNNFVYGVTLRDTSDAIRFAYNLRKSGIDFALDAVPSAERALYEDAYRGVLSSGAGQIQDISTMPLDGTFNQKLFNSRLVKAWGKANTDTEVGARMAMGLRSARNGDNIDQISTTIARYHFDYSDMSRLDEIAKVFIPFWTFASRNIPLQIVNQVARPSMYRAYESAKRNMPLEEGMILPSWLAERDPLGIGATAVFNPDLPQVDMSQQIKNLSDPLRLLSQLYPQFRLPVELAGSRQLAMDIPFSSDPEELNGLLDLPAGLLGLLTGQTVDTAGGPAVTSKTAYAATSLLPTLGVLQRLIPQAGGQDKYKERQLSSLLNTLAGIPYRQITERERQNELLGRQFALSDYLNSLQRRGYVE